MKDLISENSLKLGKLFAPIIYAVVWLGLLIVANHFLPKEMVESDTFLIIYTLVFLFVSITKSTSWSIGHEQFGIKGDSRSRILNYHSGNSGEDFWVDLFADNPDLLREGKIKELLKLLTKKEN